MSGTPPPPVLGLMGDGDMPLACWVGQRVNGRVEGSLLCLATKAEVDLERDNAPLTVRDRG